MHISTGNSFSPYNLGLLSKFSFFWISKVFQISGTATVNYTSFKTFKHEKMLPLLFHIFGLTQKNYEKNHQNFKCKCNSHKIFFLHLGIHTCNIVHAPFE